MNKFCFGVIYNGRLWEKELCVSAPVLVTICIGGVAKVVKGVLESFIQCNRYSAIFCMGVFLILQ